MARTGKHTEEFGIYEFDVTITLRRKEDRYSSDTLATVRVERQIPLNSDESAKVTLAEIVSEELNRTLGVVEARIDFEDRVRRLTAGGDIVEGRVS